MDTRIELLPGSRLLRSKRREAKQKTQDYANEALQKTFLFHVLPLTAALQQWTESDYWEHR